MAIDTTIEGRLEVVELAVDELRPQPGDPR
jgi:hypothetical protein